MKILVLLSLVWLASVSVFGQEDEYLQLPPEKLKLRNELESDKSILSVWCRLYWEIPKENPRFEELKKAQAENSRIRKLLYLASLTDDKTVKAKTKCSSKEATPMVGYLIVDKGKITYVADFSRDKFGGFSFEIYDCKELKIGIYAPAEGNKILNYVFTPLEENNLDGKITMLQCKTENREFLF